MSEFKNGSSEKLRKVNKTPQDLEALLIMDEEVIGAYKGVRDYVVFTTKRVISCNVQGITGQKKTYTSLPYSKIQAFAVESAGVFDMDGELELYFSSLGKVKFEFIGNTDIKEIGEYIAQHVL
jgi:hypothetical protein